MKPNSPQAEISRKEARHIDATLIARAEKKYGPYFSAEGDTLVILNLARRLEDANKRERQYARIVASFGKLPKPKKCKKCSQRKAQLKLRNWTASKERPCNRTESLKVIASIEECWPGFKRVPELLWNQYVDACGRCRCGRPIAPKRVSKSKIVVACQTSCTRKRAEAKMHKRTKEKLAERKALAEAME